MDNAFENADNMQTLKARNYAFSHINNDPRDCRQIGVVITLHNILLACAQGDN